MYLCALSLCFAGILLTLHALIGTKWQSQRREIAVNLRQKSVIVYKGHFKKLQTSLEKSHQQRLGQTSL